MIKNRNRLSVFSLISLLLFFSCKDETSLILNPENGNNYSIKTFTLNESESESFLIPGHGELIMDVPKVWNYNFTIPGNNQPPIITFYNLDKLWGTTIPRPDEAA